MALTVVKKRRHQQESVHALHWHLLQLIQRSLRLMQLFGSCALSLPSIAAWR